MHDIVYMKMAHQMTDLSKCQSHQVACLLVLDGRIISTGVNGSPKGFQNCCDKFNKVDEDNRKDHQAWSDVHEIHAEQNAILIAAKNGVAVDGATAYCTLKPCVHCTKLLIGVGVKRIVYDKVYDRTTCEEATKIAEFLYNTGVQQHHLLML